MLGGLLPAVFGPSADDVRADLVRDGYADVVVIPRGGGTFDFTARRGHELCRGSIGTGSHGSTGMTTCELPDELPALEAACREGVGRACALAVEKVQATQPIDWVRLGALARPGCDLEQAVACFYLGGSREHGCGASIDLPGAFGAYDRACRLGDDTGCYNLGTLRYRGVGAPADPAAAAEIWRAACDRGNLLSCKSLGVSLRDGDGRLHALAARPAFTPKRPSSSWGVVPPWNTRSWSMRTRAWGSRNIAPGSMRAIALDQWTVTRPRPTRSRKWRTLRASRPAVRSSAPR